MPLFYRSVSLALQYSITNKGVVNRGAHLFLTPVRLSVALQEIIGKYIRKIIVWVSCIQIYLFVTCKNSRGWTIISINPVVATLIVHVHRINNIRIVSYAIAKKCYLVSSQFINCRCYFVHWRSGLVHWLHYTARDVCECRPIALVYPYFYIILPCVMFVYNMSVLRHLI